MFHSEKGLFFRREPDGAVSLFKTKDGKEPSGCGCNVEFKQTLSDRLWCSAVCAVSLAGEENLRWYKALSFHDEPAEATVLD